MACTADAQARHRDDGTGRRSTSPAVAACQVDWSRNHAGSRSSASWRQDNRPSRWQARPNPLPHSDASVPRRQQPSSAGDERLHRIKSPAEQLVEVYEKLIEPTLIDPTFVTHVPSVVIPLARRMRRGPVLRRRVRAGHQRPGNLPRLHRAERPGRPGASTSPTRSATRRSSRRPTRTS